MGIQNIIKNITIIDDLNFKTKTFIGILDIGCINHSEDLLSYLPKARREYVNSFKNKIRKIQTIAADIILIYLLDKFFNIKNIDITNNNYIELNNFKIYFNKSHSKGLAVCAVSKKPIGIDIQCHKNIKFKEKIAEKYFNKNEISLIKKNEDFFDIWTRKEAQTKLFGKGVNNLNKIYCNNVNFINYKKIKGYSLCISTFGE